MSRLHQLPGARVEANRRRSRGWRRMGGPAEEQLHRKAGGPHATTGPARRASGGYELVLFCRLFQMLVRRAVLAPGQRLSLTGLALAGRRAALARRSIEPDVGGHSREELLRERDVALDHHVHVHLLRDRKVLAHLREKRPRRLREVATVIGEPPHGGLA